MESSLPQPNWVWLSTVVHRAAFVPSVGSHRGHSNGLGPCKGLRLFWTNGYWVKSFRGCRGTFKCNQVRYYHDDGYIFTEFTSNSVLEVLFLRTGNWHCWKRKFVNGGVICQGLGKATGACCRGSVWDRWSQLLPEGDLLPSQLERERRTFGKCLGSQTVPMITHSRAMLLSKGCLWLTWDTGTEEEHTFAGKRVAATRPLCACQLCGPMSRLCSLNRLGWVFSYFQLRATQLLNGLSVLLH